MYSNVYLLVMNNIYKHIVVDESDINDAGAIDILASSLSESHQFHVAQIFIVQSRN